MKKLLNTLYVFTEDVYLTLDGENVVTKISGKEQGRMPLHTINGIYSFSYPGASPKLMQACAERGIALSFFDKQGRFLARSEGVKNGNVLLRREQFRIADSAERSLRFAQNFIIGKIYNARWVLERLKRDHGLRIDSNRIEISIEQLKVSLQHVEQCADLGELRGIEGQAASVYFEVFDELILRDKQNFHFEGRNRRPPLDPVNAMLSLFYTVLSLDCASALEGVGLDSYVGFLHTDRPGRRSLALDLVEELRAPFVDRFVVSAINNRVISFDDFDFRESGECRLRDSARKKLFGAWQQKKRETINHPFLKEKIEWGLVPHVQAMFLARAVRGDLDEYPPFLWK
jgi:CRISPR-associated protein Cas1